MTNPLEEAMSNDDLKLLGSAVLLSAVLVGVLAGVAIGVFLL